jgi:diadenosine tetraphosphatase ApaH/serine/threonine PP2A family protein phosphatase
MEWTRDTIAPATKEWLGALPERIVEGPFTLVHGSPRDPTWEYVTSIPVARAGIAAMGTRYGLHGHTHVPIVFREDEGRIEPITPGRGSVLGLDQRRALLNPGSVGQPRDGDPSASWLVLDTGQERSTWHRIEYDIAAVQAAMTKAALPVRLAERLSYGI